MLSILLTGRGYTDTLYTHTIVWGWGCHCRHTEALHKKCGHRGGLVLWGNRSEARVSLLAFFRAKMKIIFALKKDRVP